MSVPSLQSQFGHQTAADQCLAAESRRQSQPCTWKTQQNTASTTEEEGPTMVTKETSLPLLTERAAECDVFLNCSIEQPGLLGSVGHRGSVLAGLWETEANR